MSSPDLPKLSKIDKSLTIPCKHGLTEQNTTDARSAFECAYYINVENYDWLLSTVYAELKLFRKAQNRDVFKADCSEIIKFIQEKAHENTNGVLRQYFPKGSCLSHYSQEELDEVANHLNNRPRKTLGVLAPARRLEQVLQ